MVWMLVEGVGEYCAEYGGGGNRGDEANGRCVPRWFDVDGLRAPLLGVCAE